MQHRHPLIAANWKMNPAPAEALEKDSPYMPDKDIDVIVFPTFFDLPGCIDYGMKCGAQYGHPMESGAFTGDISMRMIREAKAEYVMCGHSERRANHHESDEFIAQQVASALKSGLKPVLCIGETIEERTMGWTKDVLKRQLYQIILAEGTTIAYEPRWAIGTGKTPSPTEVQEIHAFIRSLIPSPLDLRILYGGSMNDKNAAELLAQPDIDGGLIGGASLKPQEFKTIVEAAKHQLKAEN